MRETDVFSCQARTVRTTSYKRSMERKGRREGKGRKKEGQEGREKERGWTHRSFVVPSGRTGSGRWLALHAAGIIARLPPNLVPGLDTPEPAQNLGCRECLENVSWDGCLRWGFGVVPANFGMVPHTLYCGLESFLPPFPKPTSGVVVPSRAFKPAPGVQPPAVPRTSCVPLGKSIKGLSSTLV